MRGDPRFSPATSENRLGRVSLPHALERKYPNAGIEVYTHVLNRGAGEFAARRIHC